MIKRWVKIEKCNKHSLKSIKGFIYFLLEGVIFLKKIGLRERGETVGN